MLKIIHSWPDPGEQQDALIVQLTRQGFGGVVCNVSFEHYLEGDAQWRAFTRAVRAAREAGMALWLYDERGYPSGNAGGIVLRDHPEWEARGLLVNNQEQGPGDADLAVPPGRLVLAAAFPVRDGILDLRRRENLESKVQAGRLRWTVPPGRWQVMAVTEHALYEGTHADGNLWQKMPYINLLQPEPTARFLEITHQRYAERLGPNLGKYFVATFTDEPSLMSLFLRPMPWRPLPWSANLPAEFRKRRGYPLDTTVIPSLIAETGSAGKRHRHDYWLTVGELVSEHFFGQIQRQCRAYGTQSGGHLLMEEGIVAHVPLYGDFFRCARRLDAPSIDCLTSLPPEVPWYIGRLLSSVADLEGRTHVMCETSDHGQVWRPSGDKRPVRVVTEAEIRGTANRLFVSGVNTLTSYYSFRDLPDDTLRRLNDWIGRCGLLLTGGHTVADVAIVYPVESLWTKFTPSRNWVSEAPAAGRIETVYRAAAEGLFQARRGFTFIDSRALREAKVQGSALVHGPLRWRAIVLPCVDTLPLAAWRNLARLVDAGGIVVALGTLPANSEAEFPAPRVQALARRLFEMAQTGPSLKSNAAGGGGIFLPAGSEGLLPLVLDGVLEPDVRVASLRAPIRVTHRHINDREVFFVINDSPEAWSGKISFSASGAGEHWEPGTGQRKDLDASEVVLSLEPYGAALFRFADAVTPRRIPLAPGLLPNLTLHPIPVTQPSLAAGEFVRSTLEPDPARSQPGRPAWLAAGSLTKSHVDTFLFACFPFTPALDLREAACLAIDTWIPNQHKTSSQLLVILREAGGGDFIASTGLSLAVAGPAQALIPLHQFQLAGWSKDSDGQLDPALVSEIRIGWGGYLGTVGERVQFSVALPRRGLLAKGAPAGFNAEGMRRRDAKER
jgi:hypothetical protein